MQIDPSFESLVDGYYNQMKLCVGIMEDLISTDSRNFKAIQQLQIKATACRDQMSSATDDILDYEDMFDDDWDDEWDDDWYWDDDDILDELDEFYDTDDDDWD